MPARVLILDDNLADARLMSVALEEFGFDHSWRHVGDEAGFSAAIVEWRPDVVLLDHSMPSFGALRAIRLMQERGVDVPTIVVSGTIGEEPAADAIRAGADDYVHKDRIQRLGPAVLRSIDHAKAERELRESETRFRALIEHATDLITLIDRSGKILYVSPSTERATGFPESALVGRQALDFVAAEDRSGAEAMLARILAEPGRSERFEYRGPTSGGSWIWLEAVTSNMLEVGGVHAIVVNQRDVTARKRDETALAERARLAELDAEVGLALTHEGTLSDVLRRCTDALVLHLDVAFARIWTLDPGGTVLELRASSGLYTHLDGAHARVPVGTLKIGRIASKRTPHVTNDVPNDPQISDPEWARREGMIAFAGYPLEIDGRLVGVVAVFAQHRFPPETLRALGSVAREVALGIERLRAESELRERRTDLEKIFRTSPGAMTINRASDGAYLEVNDEFVRALGRSREEVLGRAPGPLGIWASRQEAREVRRRLRNDGWVRNLEVTLRTKNGATLSFLYSAVTMDVRGVSSIVSFAQDVSELKATQRALRDALSRVGQSDRLKTSFLENLSHEFRTPLNVMLGYNSLIAERLARTGDHEAENLVDAVSRASHRLLRSLHAVLDLSRFETGTFVVRPSTIDLAILAREVVREHTEAAEKKGLSLSVGVETTDVETVHDEIFLREALAQLLDNAIRFTERGEISLEIRRDSDDRLTLVVRDTGIGIDPGYLPRIFSPFTQESSGRARTHDGLGIGLALVRSYLACGDATVSVDSRKDEGSSFTIRFAKERRTA